MENVLVLQAARFGDLVQTKRLIISLRQKYNVHLCVDKSLGKLARLIYPDIETHEAVFHGNLDKDKFTQNTAVFKVLRKTEFTKIYNCNFSPLTSAICRMLDEDKVIGCRPAHNSDGGIYRSPWSRIVFKLSANRRAAALNLTDFWGLMVPQPVEAEKVNPEAKPGGKGIGIALSGREARRSLPMPVLAEIAQVVFQVSGATSITLLGSESEHKAARQFLRYINRRVASKIKDMSGKTDWQGLIEEVKDLDLLLTPDTGIMHLAAHLGTPVMAFFLSSACCHETGPYGKGHLVWQAEKDCSPCLEKAPCPHEIACLQPFKQPQFLRNLALVCAKQFDNLTLSDDLQLWQTGFDQLGAVMTLKAGEDTNADLRQAARTILENYQGFFQTKKPELPQAELDDLILKLMPPEEWMLPPWRYC